MKLNALHIPFIHPTKKGVNLSLWKRLLHRTHKIDGNKHQNGKPINPIQAKIELAFFGALRGVFFFIGGGHKCGC